MAYIPKGGGMITKGKPKSTVSSPTSPVIEDNDPFKYGAAGRGEYGAEDVALYKAASELGIPMSEANKTKGTSAYYRALGSTSKTLPSAATNARASDRTIAGKTANSAGSFYGKAGTSNLATSFGTDTAGNSILGSLGGRNIIGGRVAVDRTAGVPGNPLEDYMAMLSPQSVIDRQKQARRELERERQGQMDAIREKYKAQVADEQAAGAEDLARMRSMNLRAGLGGSDFGAANKIGVRDRTQRNVRAIEANADIEIGNAINAIESAAQTRFVNEQNALNQSFTNLYNAQTYSDTKAKEAKTEMLDGLKVLAQADPTLDMAKLQKLDPQLYDSIKEGLGKTDFEIDALFKQNSGQTSEYAWRGDNLVVINKDAQGNPTGTKTYTAEDLGIPKNSEFQTLTNETTGDMYWYDPNDTTDDGAPKLRKIGKFANTLADEAAAKAAENASDGMSDKDRTIFNSIVDKYAKSPLIAAADRTIVLKSTIDNVRNDPSNGAQQLNLAYAYIQALDTYQSAVREGELALVNSIDSKIGKIEGEIQKIQNGQIVRPEVAKQLADAAETIVTTINEGAKRAEERYRSQAKVNGIEDAWNKFIGGYEQGYNDPAVQIDALLQQYPNATEEEILQLLEESGFSSVGGDTNLASNRPQRNNNPFNIKASEYTQAYPGVVGTDPVPATDGGKFLTFSSPEAGMKAGERLLRSSGYKGLTVDAAMRRWSNNGYGGEIAPSLKGKTIDQLTTAEMQQLLNAMAKREGYYA